MSEYITFKHEIIDRIVSYGKQLDGIPGVTPPECSADDLHAKVDAGEYPDEVLFHLYGLLQGLLIAHKRITDPNASIMEAYLFGQCLRKAREPSGGR